MCLRTDIVAGRPKTAFFVWGLGIVFDKRAPGFFGRQLGLPATALGWFNRLEQEGLAVGYWINLTETDETSFFSSGTDRMSREAWNRLSRERHHKGLGRSASDL